MELCRDNQALRRTDYQAMPGVETVTPRILQRELDDLLALTDEINATIEAGQEPTQNMVNAVNRLREEIERGSE